MPGGFVNWQEEWQGLWIRLLYVPLLVAMLVFDLFRLVPGPVYAVLAIIALQTLVTVAGIPRRWGWLPAANFLTNRLIFVLLLGATGGAAGPLVVVPYVSMVSVLIYFNTPRAALILVSSHVLALWLGCALSVELGFAPTWSLAFMHSLSLGLVAAVLMRPLSRLNLYAATDPLTRALNRRGGLETLEAWVTQGQPFSLVFVDIKHFKQINDTHGHAVGDEVLAWVVGVCRANLRASDLVIRYGGDEFVLAVRGHHEALTHRLEGLFAPGVETSAGRLSVQLSLGVVRFPEDGRDLEGLLKNADTQMYRHKGVDLATT
ncbi:MAG: GGDEF domain-containing protein [Meiothermus sp.]|nr:GGDEF domain-containing protein [Meiothermus sp.]